VAVYFIRAGEDGPVKIGTAEDVPDRFRNLQCGNHLELTLLRTLDGDRRAEQALHRRYEHLRSRGEWFAFTPDMLVVELSDITIEQPPTVDLSEGQSGFLREVETFIERSGMSPTALGRRAVKDPSFVTGLRNGRDLRLSTINRVREFIAAQ
jgi:hypothetical protein